MAERVIMDEAAIQRTVTRIAHEILEYNKGTDNLILLELKTWCFFSKPHTTKN